MTIFRRRNVGGRRVARPDEDPQPSPAGPDLQPGLWHLRALARGAFAETQRTGRAVKKVMWPTWLTVGAVLTVIDVLLGHGSVWWVLPWAFLAVFQAWTGWVAERLIAAQDEHIAGLGRRLETYRGNAWESGHRPG